MAPGIDEQPKGGCRPASARIVEVMAGESRTPVCRNSIPAETPGRGTSRPRCVVARSSRSTFEQVRFSAGPSRAQVLLFVPLTRNGPSKGRPDDCSAADVARHERGSESGRKAREPTGPHRLRDPALTRLRATSVVERRCARFAWALIDPEDSRRTFALLCTRLPMQVGLSRRISGLGAR